MILYNMRERGVLEYDKFALNILQIHNAITLEEIYELKQLSSSKNSLTTALKKASKSYSNIVGADDKLGVAEEVYIKSVFIRGRS